MIIVEMLNVRLEDKPGVLRYLGTVAPCMGVGNWVAGELPPIVSFDGVLYVVDGGVVGCVYRPCPAHEVYPR